MPLLWNSGMEAIFPNTMVHIKTYEIKMEKLEEGLQGDP